MIQLIVDDLMQVTILEELLCESKIAFSIEHPKVDYGIPTPYLIVNGAPLDFDRSLKWIDEHGK